MGPGRSRDEEDVGIGQVVGDAGIVRFRAEGPQGEPGFGGELSRAIRLGHRSPDGGETRPLGFGEMAGREAEAEDEEVHAGEVSEAGAP